MKLDEIFDPHGTYDPDSATNRPHAEAQAKTGFWGKAGAGCLILARDTGRLLIAHRSSQVNEPDTWGTWGGAIDEGLLPAEAVKREVHQECGYAGAVHMEPLLIFKSGSFQYHNFLVSVDQEFEPTLDWENQEGRWVTFGDWPTPMHPGLKALLGDAPSMAKIEAAVAACSNARHRSSSGRRAPHTKE